MPKVYGTKVVLRLQLNKYSIVKKLQNLPY